MQLEEPVVRHGVVCAVFDQGIGVLGGVGGFAVEDVLEAMGFSAEPHSMKEKGMIQIIAHIPVKVLVERLLRHTNKEWVDLYPQAQQILFTAPNSVSFYHTRHVYCLLSLEWWS